jgi:hypothetical protein
MKWPLDVFATYRFTGPEFTDTVPALCFLSRIRTGAFSSGLRTTKYVAAICVALEHMTPHIHALLPTDDDAKRLLRSLRSFCDDLYVPFDISFDVRPIIPTEDDMRRVATYLLDRNIKPNLTRRQANAEEAWGHRPAHLQLLTGSGEAKFGRPKGPRQAKTIRGRR